MSPEKGLLGGQPGEDCSAGLSDAQIQEAVGGKCHIHASHEPEVQTE